MSFGEYKNKIINEEYDELFERTAMEHLVEDDEQMGSDDSLQNPHPKVHDYTLDNSSRFLNKKIVRSKASPVKSLKLNLAANSKI